MNPEEGVDRRHPTVSILKIFHEILLPTKTRMTMTTMMVGVLVLIVIPQCCALLSSSVNSDPNLSFTYFNQISDPSMNIYETPVGYSNPFFNKLIFRSDNGELYLAGMDFLYILNPSNISIELNRRVNLSAHPDFENIRGGLMVSCDLKLKRRYPTACQNIVQMLFWRSSQDHLRVCTSGFGTPKEFVVDIREMKVIKMSTTNATGKCSGIPFSNFTSLYDEKVNAIFSGTPETQDKDWYYGKYALDSSWEVVSALRSTKIHQPHEISYVASLDIDAFVYIFLHERPQEVSNGRADKSYYTRVARICKNEPGNMLYTDRAVTYVKLRMFCADNEKLFDVYYDVITDVYFNSSSNKFYLLLSTINEDASAVCVLDRTEVDSKIQEAPLSGRDSNYCWVTMTEFWPNEPRPQSCVVRSNLTAGEWTYYSRFDLSSKTADLTLIMTVDIFFTRFVVEQLLLQEFIFWLYTPNERGYLTRMYFWRKGGQLYRRRIAKIKLFKYSSQISELRDLKMETVNGKTYVFAVMEKLVVQVNLEMCSGHVRCTTCAVDPYCAWLVQERKCVNKNEVQSRDKRGYISDPQTNSSLSLCLDTCLGDNKEIFVISGSNAAVACNSFCSPDDSSFPVWYHGNQEVFPRKSEEDERGRDVISGNEHLLLTGESNRRLLDVGGYKLYLLNATHNFSGDYECRDSRSGEVFAATKVTVTKYCKIEGNFESTWRREFHNWCTSYEAYAASFHDWKLQTTTSQCSNMECIKSCCSP